MISEPKNTLICFIDGSCSDQTRKIRTAGYSVVWPFHNEFDEAAQLQNATVVTNNRAEFTALIRALQIADDIDPHRIMTVHAYTDSMLLINSVTKWLPGWKRNNWIKADKKLVQNIDLLRIIDELTNLRNLTFTHVKAHTGNADWHSIWNDIADERAKSSHFTPSYTHSYNRPKPYSKPQVRTFTNPATQASPSASPPPTRKLTQTNILSYFAK